MRWTNPCAEGASVWPRDSPWNAGLIHKRFGFWVIVNLLYVCKVNKFIFNGQEKWGKYSWWQHDGSKTSVKREIILPSFQPSRPWLVYFLSRIRELENPKSPIIESEKSGNWVPLFGTLSPAAPDSKSGKIGRFLGLFLTNVNHWKATCTEGFRKGKRAGRQDGWKNGR